MKWALIFFLFWLPQAFAEPSPLVIHPTQLIEAEITPAFEKKLIKLGKIKDVNILLEQIVKEFPELRILIVGKAIGDSALTGDPIRWRDYRVPKSAVEFYEKPEIMSQSEMSATMGMHIAINASPSKLSNRPLYWNTLLLLRPNAGRGVIFHELIHHFFNTWYVEKYILAKGNSVFTSPSFTHLVTGHMRNLMDNMFREEVISDGVRFFEATFLIERYLLMLAPFGPAEEVEVVLAICRLQKKLGLTRAEVAGQAQYGLLNTLEIQTNLREKLTGYNEFLAGAIPMIKQLRLYLSPGFVDETLPTDSFIPRTIDKMDRAIEIFNSYTLKKQNCDEVLNGSFVERSREKLKRIFR